MVKNVLSFKYFRVLKNYVTNKIPALGVILLFMISTLSAAYPQTLNSFENHNRAIVWDVALNFDEPGAAYDYAIFGEAPNANDGPPADVYDTVKPPAPMPSYIRAWFDDNLPYPYNTLLMDCRHYPDLNKIWNLSVQWVPSDYISPTTITISWNPSEFNPSEYISITLCTSGGTPLKDMLVYSSYSFVCPAFIPQTFTIICIGNQAPNIPSNPSPLNSSIAVPVNADLSWTCSDPDGDPLTYDVYFGTSSSPSIIASNISGSTYALGTMSPNTLYYWYIVAWDIYSANKTGPVWHFYTNHLPNPPSNPTPSNGSTGISVNAILSWTCNDPDSDPLTYDVFFGTSSSPSIVSSNQTTTTYNPGTMGYGTTYYWKIVAWDINSGSRAGPVWHFKTNSLPNQPNNPNPSNGSTNVSINTDLSWLGGDPDSGDTVTYDVYFGTSSTPPHVVYNQSGLSYNPPGNLLYNTLYYWIIVAWDNHGASAVGPLWHFTTGVEPNQPPYVPSSPSPANGSTGVSINTDFSWTGGDPDSGDTVTYDVYFGTSSNPPHVSFNQSTLNYDPGMLAYSTVYYWRIIAWDNHDASAVGPLWHFTTGGGNQPPYVPSSPSPVNGSTSVSVNVNLGWVGGDPDSGDTVTYDVYFGMSSSPPIVSHNQSSLSYDPGTLVYYTLYYWKIVAWDNHDASTPGPLWHFKTAYATNHPPYAPSNPSPVNGSTQIPVNSDLSWTGGDPDSGDFVTYDVYFSSSYPPLTKIKSNTSGTSCMLDNLNYSLKYYWKVVAWDNHGNTNVSPIWSFTTILDKTPPTLAITQPKKLWIYINLLLLNIHKKFPIFITTAAIGPVDVIATASDSQSGVNRVEFYLDDVWQTTVYSPPYSWAWTERGGGFPYLITVKAYDNVGNGPSILTLRVWKIL